MGKLIYRSCVACAVTVFVFGNLPLLQSLAYWRYYNSGEAETIVVRPTGTIQGTKCFMFSYCQEERQITVANPVSGGTIGVLPGRWGPNTLFWKAETPCSAIYFCAASLCGNISEPTSYHDIYIYICSIYLAVFPLWAGHGCICGNVRQ